MLKFKRKRVVTQQWLGAYMQHCLIFTYLWDGTIFDTEEGKNEAKMRKWKWWDRVARWGWRFRAIFCQFWSHYHRSACDDWCKPPKVIIKGWFVLFSVHLGVSSMTLQYSPYEPYTAHCPFIPVVTCQAEREEIFSWDEICCLLSSRR